MSYSKQITINKADPDWGNQVINDLTGLEKQYNDTPETAAAVVEHLDAIKLALDILVPVTGGEDVKLSVNIAGHANPEHEPRDGYASEALTISISEQSQT